MSQRQDNALTHATPKQVFSAMKAALGTLGFEPALDDASVLVLLSQWALETGRGAFMHNWNIGNVKAVPGGSWDWVFFKCDELDAQGHIVWYEPPPEGQQELPDDDAARAAFIKEYGPCSFRAYATLVDGVTDYLKLLHKKYAAAWPAVIGGDVTQFGHILHVDHYYTAVERTEDHRGYLDNLESIYREFTRTILHPSLDLHSVAGAQAALNELGTTPPLAVDGVAGPKTTAAIRHFQVANGLQADGKLSDATVSAMGAALTPTAQAA